MKGFESLFLSQLVAASNRGAAVVALATKYKVPFFVGKAQSGCPGIMNPLGTTPEIELRWGSGFHNEDKTNRFTQFTKALEVMESYGSPSFKNKYLELDIYGRVLLTYIAEKNDCFEQIWKSIEGYADQGLHMGSIPYGKGGAKVEEIFKHYILLKAPSLTPLPSASLGREDISGAVEKEEEKESKIPSKESALPKKRVSDDFLKIFYRAIDDEHDAILDIAEKISDGVIEDACTESCPSILNLLMHNDLDALMAVALSGEEITEISY